MPNLTVIFKEKQGFTALHLMLFFGATFLASESPAYSQGIVVLHHFYISQDTGSPVYLSAELPDADGPGLGLEQIPSLQSRLEQLAPSERLLVVKQVESHDPRASLKSVGLKLYPRNFLPDQASCAFSRLFPSLLPSSDIEFYGDPIEIHTLQGDINSQCSQVKTADGEVIPFSSTAEYESYPDGLWLMVISPLKHTDQESDTDSFGVPGVSDTTDLRELLSGSYSGDSDPKFDFKPGGSGLSNLMDISVMMSLLPTAREKREGDRPVLVLGSQEGVLIQVTDAHGYQWRRLYTMEQAKALLEGVEDKDSLLSRRQSVRMSVSVKKVDDLSRFCQKNIAMVVGFSLGQHIRQGVVSAPETDKEKSNQGNNGSSGKTSKGASNNNSGVQTTISLGAPPSVKGTGSGGGDREDDHRWSYVIKSQCEASEYLGDSDSNVITGVKAENSSPSGSRKAQSQPCFREQSFSYQNLHKLFEPEVLTSLCQGRAPPRLVLEKIEVERLPLLLMTYDSLISGGTTFQDHERHTVPFSALFQVNEPASRIYELYQAQSESFIDISFTLQDQESARVLLLALSYIISRPVAFLDFRRGLLTENSFVSHPDLSVSIINTANAAVYLNELNNVLLVIPDNNHLSLYDYSPTVEDDGADFLKCRARAMSDFITESGLRFISNSSFYKPAVRTLSQYAQRGTKEFDKISVLRVFPGYQGLFHSEHLCGCGIFRDERDVITLLAAMAGGIQLHNYEAYKKSADYWRDIGFDNIKAKVGEIYQGLMEKGEHQDADKLSFKKSESVQLAGSGNRDASILSDIRQRYPDFIEMIKMLTHLLYDEQSEIDEALIKELIEEVEMFVHRIEDQLTMNEHRYISAQIIKIKSSQRYKLIIEPEHHHDWQEINKALEKLLLVSGEDQGEIEELDDWGEMHNNFRLAMKLNLEHKTLIKLIFLLIKRLDEISVAFPGTARHLAEEVHKKVQPKIREYDTAGQTVDIELADAIFNAYVQLEKPGTQAERLNPPPVEEFVKWSPSQLLAFWKRTNSLNLYKLQDREFMLENPEFFLWIIKQSAVDYNNAYLRSQFVRQLRKKNITPTRELLESYWLTLISEHRRLISTPVFNQETVEAYMRLPEKERVRRVERLTGGSEDFRSIKANLEMVLALNQPRAGSPVPVDHPEKNKQLQLLRAVRDIARAGNLGVNAEGSLVLTGTELAAPLLPPSRVVKGLKRGVVYPPDVVTLTEKAFQRNRLD